MSAKTVEPATTNSPGRRKDAQQLPDVTRRRRLGLFRGIIIVVTTSAALIMFVSWYRGYPHKSECRNAGMILARALQDYAVENRRLPAVFESLELKKKPFIVAHFEYAFIGFGMSANLPDGTIVAHCRQTHEMLFHPAWRYVLIYDQGRIVVRLIPESEFEQIQARQKRGQPFFNYDGR